MLHLLLKPRAPMENVENLQWQQNQIVGRYGEHSKGIEIEIMTGHPKERTEWKSTINL